jgi:hypothetical protein
VGTKLSPEQYTAVELRAQEQGIGVSEYVRRTLLTAQQQPNIIAVLLVLLQELMALRNFIINHANEQASGKPLTTERVQAMRTHADANKAERARTLLSETTSNKSKLAVVSENGEAA